MRPLVGVICCTRAPQDDPVQGVAERYMQSAPFIGADMVLVPSMPGILDMAATLRRLDGVLLTGSPSNVLPARYGEVAAGDGPFDPARDETTARLIDAAVAQDKPLLGICRGFQEVAVAFGSTLRRDLGEPGRNQVHHTPTGLPLAQMFALRHGVTLAAGGVLARALGAERIEVNSAHFQGVSHLGDELIPEAVSADGIVESVRPRDGARILAVQWHPEWRTAEDPPSRAIFALFGAMLRGGGFGDAAQAAIAANDEFSAASATRA